jgi:hypothetical protein
VSDLFAPQALTALFQVITIDLVLAGDNAILIGLAATGLPAAQRSKGILIGIGAATLLRVVFAAVTTQLLQVVGLLLAGGFLRRQRHAPDGVRKIIGDNQGAARIGAYRQPPNPVTRLIGGAAVAQGAEDDLVANRVASEAWP